VLEVAQTGFGAPWDSPARTVSVLRAQAAAAGLALFPVEPTHAAAAAVAAHAWTVACRRPSLTAAGTLPTGVTAAASQILARAAGHSTWHRPVVILASVSAEEPLSCPAKMMREISPALAWTKRTFEDSADVAAVLAHAGLDLILAGSHVTAATGWALLGEADATLVGP
jgi:hypothetical protein